MPNVTSLEGITELSGRTTIDKRVTRIYKLTYRALRDFVIQVNWLTMLLEHITAST
ncbi:MAG: hypothetical protein ABJ327_13750 [Litoreibacter sp.]